MSKILSINDATNASIGYTRPLREGEQVLNAGFVISVGLKKKEGSILHIQALVLRTSGISTQHPYLVEIWVDVDKEYGSRVLEEKSIECECKAGESEKCKHIIAVMLFLSRVEESSLEDLTCTDIEQQWGVLKTSTLTEYQAKPLSELCHVKNPTSVHAAPTPQITSEMKKKWENRLVRSHPSGEYPIFFSTMRKGARLVDDVSDKVGKKYNSAIINRVLTNSSMIVMGRLHNLTVSKVETLNSHLREFYENHIEVSTEQSISIAGIIQGSKEWMNHRKKILTASTARSQYTYSLNNKANWEKRYNNLYHSTFSGNEDTIRGLRCEGLAKELYEDLTGTKVFECGLLIRPELPWLGASLDGVAVDKGEILRIIEIKTVKEGTRLNAAELLQVNVVRTLDKEGLLKTTTDHYGQVQIGMLVSGLLDCDYLVYSEKGNDCIRVIVKFDAPYTLDLVSRLIAVYFDVFLPKIKLDFSS